VSLILFLVAGLLSRWLLPALYCMGRGPLLKVNYRQEPVPVAGTLFPLVALASLGPLVWMGRPAVPVLGFLWGLTGMALLGLMDDIAGGTGPKGFRGHLGMLGWQRKLSSGALKALAGGLVALTAAASFSYRGWELPLDAALVALSANAVNLLDLRPGRATKGFLIVGAAVALGSRGPGALLLVPLLGAATVYLPADLSRQAMLGDVGAYALGTGLGMALALDYGLPVRIAALGLLLVIHLYAEQGSLSTLIRQRSTLRWLDDLGCGRE